MKKLKFLLFTVIIVAIAFYLMSPLLHGEYIHPLGEYEIYKSFMVNFIDTLKHGELPVWNEYVGGGHPAMYFGHYPISQNTLLYMVFGFNDFTYYFVRFLNLFILLASFIYAGKILKFDYPTSVVGALIYFSVNFVPRYLPDKAIDNLFIYPLLIVLLFEIIRNKKWKTILIFSMVYIFWLSGGQITYVYIHLIMLSVIYWIGVYVIDSEPLKLKNLKKVVVLYFILFILPIAAVLYQYYFVYDVIRASNRLKEGLIVSPFESIVWQQLWGSFKSSSYFWIGVFLIPLSFIRKSVQISKIITVIAVGLLSYIIIAEIQFTSTSNIVSDYIPILNSNDFRVALLLYIFLSQLIFSRHSGLPSQVSIYDFVVFAVYVFLMSHYFYSPGNIAGMDYGLFKELSAITRIIFVLCILFSMKSYRSNKIVKITIISLIVLYLIRSHFTIPLMRFTGVVWYPTRDGISFSALFAFLFLFGLKNMETHFSSSMLKSNPLGNNILIVKPVRYTALLVLLVLLTHDSFNKFYNGQTNKVVFPNQMHLTNTAREVEVLKSREEIPTLNEQLLDLDKTTKHFYRIFAPEAVFVYLSGYLQDHKIYDAAIYESSISKDYKDFFDYVILKKPLLDSKEIKNVLPHGVFTKHIYSGLRVSLGQIPYNDVYLFSAGDAPYLKNQNIEFFWDIMQVKYLVVSSAFSKALEEFSDKENYKLLGYYPSLDLNLYEITKNKKYSKFGILPLGDNEDFDKVMERINSRDTDVLKDVYARVIYLDKNTKDFTLLKSQSEQSRRYYEIDAKQKGMLIEFESWNSHWGLTVNKEKKDLYKAFRIFRGIRIEPGRNVIELRYNVPYFKELFWLSVLTILLYCFLMAKFMAKKL